MRCGGGCSSARGRRWPEAFCHRGPLARSRCRKELRKSIDLFALALPTFSLSLYGPLLVVLAALAVLASVGRVPIRYSLRNLLVRWRTTLLTALAFMLVVGLMIVMLAFVTAMSHLTEQSGQPGNVIVLSDGAIDELFSNFEHAETSDVERQPGVSRDESGQPLSSRGTDLGGIQDTGTVVGTRPKRRFVQVRGIEDPLMSARVHGLNLYPGGQWWSEAGVQQIEGNKSADSGTSNQHSMDAIQAVVGEGIAREMGR